MTIETSGQLDAPLLGAVLDHLGPVGVTRAERDESGAIVDLVYVYANAALREVFAPLGLEPVGASMRVLAPPGVDPALMVDFVAVAETGVPMLSELPLLRPDGQFGTVEVMSVRFGDGVLSWGRDVTEERTLDAALRASEGRYRLITEHVGDAVLETRNRVVEWASPSVARLFGYSAEEMVGVDLAALMDPDDLAEYSRLRAARPTEALRFRARTHLPDGGIRWLDADIRPRPDADGEYRGAMVVTAWNADGVVAAERDLAMAQRALATLSAANRQIGRFDDEGALLQHMCDAIVTAGGYSLAAYIRPGDGAGRAQRTIAMSTSADGRFLDEEGMRAEHDLLASHAIHDIVTHVHELVITDVDDDPRFPQFRGRSAASVVRSFAAFPVSFWGGVDGVLALASAQPHSFDGQALDLFRDLADDVGRGLAHLRNRDLLAKVTADRTLLGTAIDQANEAVYITDIDANIVYVNPAATRSSGYSADELLGENPRLLQGGVHDAEYYREIWAALTSGQAWHGEFVNRSKSGQRYREETTITPVHDDEGRVVAYVSVGRDVTLERTLEASVVQAQHDRDIVMHIIDNVRPGPTIAETARDLCDAVREVPGFDGVSVVVDRFDGTAVPVGLGQPLLAGVRSGDALPLAHWPGLLARTRRGAWWVDLTARTAGLEPELEQAAAAAEVSAVAFGPIARGGEILGPLIIASRDPAAPAWMQSRIPVVDELAALAGNLVGEQILADRRAEVEYAEIRRDIDERRFSMVFQPVVELGGGRVVGYEALTRFTDAERPDLRFARAHAVGLGPALEAVCAQAALDAIRFLPAEVWCSINFSPDAVIGGVAAEIVCAVERDIVVEITEHVAIESYAALRKARIACGHARLAVDDAGAGFASLRHILELQPDFVKLDLALVHDIDTDPARQALVTGLVHFAAQTGATLIAEGVETRREADTLFALGVRLAQGFLLGRPDVL